MKKDSGDGSKTPTIKCSEKRRVVQVTEKETITGVHIGSTLVQDLPVMSDEWVCTGVTSFIKYLYSPGMVITYKIGNIDGYKKVFVCS